MPTRLPVAEVTIAMFTRDFCWGLEKEKSTSVIKNKKSEYKQNCFWQGGGHNKQ